MMNAQQDEPTLRELISQINPDVLRDFIYRVSLEDPGLQNRIRVCFSPDIYEEDLKLLRHEIDDICYRFTDKGGFIKFQDAEECCRLLFHFVEEKIKFLIGNRHFMEAFHLTNHIFQTLERQVMDDSRGASDAVAKSCYQCWKLILLNLDNEVEKNTMYQWFLSHLEDCSLDFMGDYIYDFLLYEFHDRELIDRHLKLLDRLIEDNRQSGTDCGSLKSCYYGQQNNLVQRIELMRILGMSELDIYEYRRTYRHFSTVRQMSINEYMEHGNYERAILVLKESKILDKAYPGLLAVYSLNLIDLYEKLELWKAYKEELFCYLSSFPQKGTVAFGKLKKTCTPAEWPEIREQIFVGLPKGPALYDMFLEEGLTKRLIQCLKEDGTVQDLLYYESFLKKEADEGILEIYRLALERLAKAAGERKEYRELAKALTHLKTRYGASGLAQELVEGWRSAYRGRKVMLEEIGKI